MNDQEYLNLREHLYFLQVAQAHAESYEEWEDLQDQIDEAQALLDSTPT